MTNAEEVKLYFNFVINKEKSKVLFAEAGSDFVDILLSFLVLPLGTIVNILEKHYGDEAPVIGSFNTLYTGVANLDSVYFRTESVKNMLLNPDLPYEYSIRRLKLSYTKLISSYSGKQYDGVFTKSAACFIINDDLQVMPNVADSVVQTLSNLSIAITDMDGTETKNVAFGLNEVMALLKVMLTSRDPLTALLLGGRGRNLATVRSEHETAFLLGGRGRNLATVRSEHETALLLGGRGGNLMTGRNSATVRSEHETALLLGGRGGNLMTGRNLATVRSEHETVFLLGGRGRKLATVRSEHETAPPLNQIDEKASSMNPKKMVLKATIQKSTNKFVFAQADHDFVNFLFGLLTLPLGAAEWYFGSNSGLKNIDNLHRSVAADNLDRQLSDHWAKQSLTNPIGETSNEFYPLNFDPKRDHNYVEGSRMYMVHDDLTVAPLGITSAISLLNELNISFTDVEEFELQVGLEEGLSILKAALTSTTALTDGLIRPKLKIRVK